MDPTFPEFEDEGYFLDWNPIVGYEPPQETPHLTKHPAGGWVAWKSDGNVITLMDSADASGKHRGFSQHVKMATIR